jgi:hypothetical protein
MDAKGFKQQFSKLRPIVKMNLKVDSSNFFDFESFRIGEK